MDDLLVHTIAFGASACVMGEAPETRPLHALIHGPHLLMHRVERLSAARGQERIGRLHGVVEEGPVGCGCGRSCIAAGNMSVATDAPIPSVVPVIARWDSSELILRERAGRTCCMRSSIRAVAFAVYSLVAGATLRVGLARSLLMLCQWAAISFRACEWLHRSHVVFGARSFGTLRLLTVEP